MKCTYFNSGNYYFFNPNAMIYPPNNEPAQKALDFYTDLAKRSGRKDCYVVTTMPESWHHTKLGKHKKKQHKPR
jgi:hypothetical protein